MRIKFLFKNFTLFCALTSIANAANYWHTNDWQHNFVFSIAGGPAWTNTGNQQITTLYYPGRYFPIQTYYNNRNQNDTIAVGEIFFGTYQELSENLQGQFGAEVAWSGKAVASGQIWRNNNPNFVSTYAYNISQFRVSAKGKMILDHMPVTSLIQPFLTGSAGLGLNNSYNYDTTIYPPDSGPKTLLYSNNTVYAFTYTIGAGLQYPITPFYQLAIGYEFASWGKSKLGPVPNVQSNNTLSLGNIYTSAIIFSLTYTA